MVTIAKLNSDSFLIGTKKVSEKKAIADKSIIVNDDIDLPLNGTYKWHDTQKCFLPLGHGFDSPKRPPVADALVLYRICQSRKKPHKQVREWMNWYEESMLTKHEELASARKKHGSV